MSTIPVALQVAAVLVLATFVVFAASGENITDPVEVATLRKLASVFRQLEPLWDFSVDPCSGLKGWGRVQQSDQFQDQSGISCQCEKDVCHVTKLAIVGQNLVGSIPPEIANFSYLADLNLGQNLLFGRIPDEFGRLSRLKYLNVALNKLSGPLPKSLGNITGLINMGVGLNFFSGALPKEMGSLKHLTGLYMDSCQLSGEIPVEFANLTSLQILQLFDNNFSGSIPEFLGSLTNLTSLKLYGNKFSGQIPASIWNLKSLETLMIGDVSSGGSIPPIRGNLVNLTTLSMRNCELQGTADTIGNLSSLSYLDLSFNKLSGRLPPSFGSLTRLQTLLLANNSFMGSVPAELERPKLDHLDLSFNNLSGVAPVWLTKNATREFSIIGNKINISSSNGPVRQCLESDLNCAEVSSGADTININCGGPAMESSGVAFLSDDIPLLTNAYFSKSSPFFAVSSSGSPDSGDFSPLITAKSSSQSLQPSLYQTARASLGSIRYFGLGLPSGTYDVKLHFSEIVIPDNTSWRGLPRRFFDVYIQGSRVLKDFNIQNEAGGSNRPLVKNFSTSVSNKMLDIMLLWRGRGSCCSPEPNSFGPLISAIQIGRAPQKSSSKGLALGIGLGAGALVALLAAAALVAYMMKRQKKRAVYNNLKAKVTFYSFKELSKATGNFSSDHLLGKGGFGSVYKGTLGNGTVVAVKVLSAEPGQAADSEFMNEVAVISATKHRNLVKLLGCCIADDRKILVYEYLENNSLFQALLSPRKYGVQPVYEFGWSTRFDIILGVAKGLAYLHDESSPRIVHRDIKASNILLDANMTPKISDFGLAKLFKDYESHVSTRVAGTLGYLAPEYAMLGQLTEKADVYSFGVLALEIVSGRENLQPDLGSDRVYLLEWGWERFESGEAVAVVDPNLESFDEAEAVRAVQVALLCCQVWASARPSMSQVCRMLSGLAAVDVSSLRPGYFAALKNAAPKIFDSNTASNSNAAPKIFDSNAASNSNAAPKIFDSWSSSSQPSSIATELQPR